MKLSQLDYAYDEAKQVEITNHLGKSFEPKAFISVLPWKSKVGARALIEMQREMMAVAKEFKDDPLMEDKIYDCGITGLSKIITGWTGIDDEKGKPLKFTPENTLSVISNRHIKEIVDHFASNLGNFLKG